jgi:16S rRNA (uracil1498-N3)-methyltransferase
MRFYVPPESIFRERNIIEIRNKEELHHIRDVMRLGKGAAVDVFDGCGREYSGEIKNIDRNSAVIEIKKIRDRKKHTSFSVTLYQAIPKKNKMDLIIEKAVEMGVDSIVPIITERTLPKIPRERERKKIERWERIIKAASNQCGRVILPAISDIKHFNDCLMESKKKDLVIFAALDKDAMPLKEILQRSRPREIAVFVGPEGDFSPREIAMAGEQGYGIYSLGPLVLKVDTAAIYILSCLNHEYGN